ncbi:TIGR01459 family HAD-type hydrolase [Aurantimonas sp. VKM B-3413]|uniref:TIGR01459 family HAD-type hydrolase n=1 Tax=Aurantimonas sp. VKM B-3413 TaxID=2779401 RepID=UPI001E573385|nr:TIGR01459 family HAD-type hydrolase [Aurantimonas sp. VKM B-3413]MCB8836387.1 TIGR01459 family HAD-type hydrolase [Aurantimonas sp. VKM B-3413]
MELLDGIATLADRYDAFFLDQFGVVHDGTSSYPGAAEAIERLSRLGKAVLFITNSGRPAAFNEARLARLGVPRERYLACVTSGDVAIALLEAGRIPLPVGRRLRCLTISSEDDFNLSDRLGFSRVETGAEADIVVVAGSQAGRIAISEYEARMRPAAERGVPCLCTNPDRHMLTPSGLVPAAGALADIYASMGGPVTFVGKPYRDIYEAAHVLVPDTPKSRILCVGDSIDHDVAGAAGFGAARALVRTGILDGVGEEEIAARLREAKLSADHHLAALRW